MMEMNPSIHLENINIIPVTHTGSWCPRNQPFLYTATILIQRNYSPDASTIGLYVKGQTVVTLIWTWS